MVSMNKSQKQALTYCLKICPFSLQPILTDTRCLEWGPVGQSIGCRGSNHVQQIELFVVAQNVLKLLVYFKIQLQPSMFVGCNIEFFFRIYLWCKLLLLMQMGIVVMIFFVIVYT